MVSVGHKEEFPLDSLNMDELLMQFKLVKALGYHSLFDPNFRREIRNPVRRYLYYRLIAYDEGVTKKFKEEMLLNLVNRINYFQNPEMYKEVKKEEDRLKLSDPEISSEIKEEVKSRFEKMSENYVPMSDGQQKNITELLKKL